MTRRRWIRNRPGPDEERAAAGLALAAATAVGLVVFYFARIFLSREELTSAPESGERLRAGRGRSLEPERGEGGSE